MTLTELQHSFAADIWDEDLNQLWGVVIDDRLSASRRFGVYRNNVLTSMIDAMQAIYPVIEQLVGPEFFRYMADRYVRANPSRSGNLQNVGQDFPIFLGQFAAAATLPYLADMARLEWSYHVVFHAAEPAAFAPQSLQRLTGADLISLRLKLGPACRLLQSTYPIFRIWQVNQDGRFESDNVNLDSGAESVLIVRPESEVELWKLSVAESVLLSALESGVALGNAVDKALSYSADFDLSTLLSKYMSCGALIDCNG